MASSWLPRALSFWPDAEESSSAPPCSSEPPVQPVHCVGDTCPDPVDGAPLHFSPGLRTVTNVRAVSKAELEEEARAAIRQQFQFAYQAMEIPGMQLADSGMTSRRSSLPFPCGLGAEMGAPVAAPLIQRQMSNPVLPNLLSVEMAYPVLEAQRVDPDSTLGQMKKHAQELIQIGKATSVRSAGRRCSGPIPPSPPPAFRPVASRLSYPAQAAPARRDSVQSDVTLLEPPRKESSLTLEPSSPVKRSRMESALTLGRTSPLPSPSGLRKDTLLVDTRERGDTLVDTRDRGDTLLVDTSSRAYQDFVQSLSCAACQAAPGAEGEAAVEVVVAEALVDLPPAEELEEGLPEAEEDSESSGGRTSQADSYPPSQRLAEEAPLLKVDEFIAECAEVAQAVEEGEEEEEEVPAPPQLGDLAGLLADMEAMVQRLATKERPLDTPETRTPESEPEGELPATPRSE